MITERTLCAEHADWARTAGRKDPTNCHLFFWGGGLRAGMSASVTAMSGTWPVGKPIDAAKPQGPMGPDERPQYIY